MLCEASRHHALAPPHAPCPPAHPPRSMLEVMRPLGLPATRLAAVRGIARDFLASDWEDPAEFKHWWAAG